MTTDPRAEIHLIAANQRKSEQVLARVLKSLTRDMTELDIRRKVRAQINDADADEAFDTIVASGVNSSVPHAKPSSKQL